MTMFAFRDFAPRQTRAAGFFQSAESDNLMEAVQQANLWVQEHQVRVINIETVVIPNCAAQPLEQPSESGHLAPMPTTNQCFQFIRVWYEFEHRPHDMLDEESEE